MFVCFKEMWNTKKHYLCKFKNKIQYQKQQLMTQTFLKYNFQVVLLAQLIRIKLHRNIDGSGQLGCSGPISIFNNKLQYLLKMVSKNLQQKLKIFSSSSFSNLKQICNFVYKLRTKQ